MLSLNLDMTTVFEMVNTMFNALWPIAAITIGIPFAIGLVSYVGSQMVKAFKGRG